MRASHSFLFFELILKSKLNNWLSFWLCCAIVSAKQGPWKSHHVKPVYYYVTNAFRLNWFIMCWLMRQSLKERCFRGSKKYHINGGIQS